MAGTSQYFEPDPAVGSQPRTIDLVLPDVHLVLTADRGVFASAGVDPGTKLLLLDGPPPSPSARTIVDLGCGYGPIALTLARRVPSAQVWAVDVNRRAVELCAANARTNGIDNVRAVTSDAVPADLTVDEMWSNPPIRIGKPALHELLASWLARLAPDGRAVLVVQKHLGSDSLARWLAESGWAATRIRSRSGYRLLEVTRA